MSAQSRDARPSDRVQFASLPKSLSGLAVALVFIVTLVATYAARQVEIARSHDRERALAQRAAAALETIMRATGGSLLGAQVLGVQGPVKGDAFNAFATGILSDTQSDFSTIGYEPVIADSRRAQFEKTLGAKIRDRLASGGFVTAPRRPEYAPVEFVEPQTREARILLGFDLLADPTRGAALIDARKAGAPRSTAPQLLAVTNRPGINVIEPVYAPSSASMPNEVRPVLGFVSGVVPAQDLGTKVTSLLPAKTGVLIKDQAGLLYATSRGVSASAPEVKIAVLGRTFTVTAASPEGISFTWPGLILLAGLSATGFTARTLRVSAVRTRAMRRANLALDRAIRDTAVIQELTARLSSSATSADMAAAITSHLREHEPDLLGSGVIMMADVDSAVRLDDSIDGLPDALVADVADPDQSLLTEAARKGFAQFGGGEFWSDGIDPTSIAVVPLNRGGQTAAVVLLAYTAPQRFESEQRLRLTTVAALGSQALERALRFDEEHAMATVLQRSLLPHRLPQVPGVSVAVRYIPATETALVGGDWYDAFTVESGLAIIVGDAVGHGVEAAAAMGQIRSAIRVAMLAGESPASTLTVLDTFVDHVQGATDATAVAAILDTDHGRLRISRAGHIPPLLIRNGEAVYLEQGGALPLGWPDHTRLDADVELEPGDIIIMVTDGVVERRDDPLEARLREFAALAGAAGTDIERLCDVLVFEMGVERPSDDVVLLAVKYHGLD